MSRIQTRQYLHALLTGRLSDLVDHVYGGRPADFEGRLKVVCVYSAGTNWTYASKGKSRRAYPLAVDIFIKYADEETDWTEAEAEDLLDQVSDRVLDVVDASQATEYWSSLSVPEQTQTGDVVDVNGTEYRRETILIYPV